MRYLKNAWLYEVPVKGRGLTMYERTSLRSKIDEWFAERNLVVRKDWASYSGSDEDDGYDTMYQFKRRSIAILFKLTFGSANSEFTDVPDWSE